MNGGNQTVRFKKEFYQCMKISNNSKTNPFATRGFQTLLENKRMSQAIKNSYAPTSSLI